MCSIRGGGLNGNLNLLKVLKEAAMNKHLVFVIAAMFLLTGYAISEETKSANMPVKKDAGTNKKAQMMKDRVMMQNGKMMVVKNGRKMKMDSVMPMPNGTMVMQDGTCTLKDGTKMMMKEGDSMDMNGKLIKNKKMAEKKLK